MNTFLKYFIVIQLFAISFESFGQTFLTNEKINLQTDRDIYIAGEEVFFNCYCYTNRKDNNTAISKFAYLSLRNEKNIVIIGICLKLENNTFSGSFTLPDTLSTGRYQLVSYTNTMRNFAESNFPKKEILVANRFDKELYRLYSGNFGKDTSVVNVNQSHPESNLVRIIPEKLNYSKREKVRVKLSALGLKDNETARFTVSVHEKTYQQDDKAISNTTSFSNKNCCQHFPELNKIILEGQVLDNNKQGLPNVLVYLSVPDTFANLQHTLTNKNGVFLFQLNDYYNFKNLIISLPENPAGQIVLDDKFSLKEPFIPSRVFSDSLLKDYIIKSQNIIQVQKEYKTLIKKELPDTSLIHDTPPLVYPFVSDPVYPSEFEDLPDFIEISRELLPLVKTRKHGFGYETRIVDKTNSAYFDSSPLLFLDGVPINNINQVINFGTKKIKKIETLGVERFYCGKLYPGILAIFSKNMEINNIVWQTPIVNVNYVQFQPKAEYVRLGYEKTDKGPDFRQLLYWEPNGFFKENSDKTFEFFTSDNKGEFEISVEGITSDGKKFKSATIITIGNFK